MSWKHDDLAGDLAIAIGPTPFLNVPMGSVWLARKGHEPPRADVIVVKPSYTRFCVAVYEVKVSRADFLSDIRSDKWRSYLPHCHRFYFAVAAGVAQKGDIPPEAGLIVRGPNGWSVSKGAPCQSIEIPAQTLLSLLFARQRAPVRYRQVDQIIDAFGFSYSYKKDDQKQARLVGKALANAYARREEYDRLISDQQNIIRNIEHKQNVVDDFIQECLGIERDGPVWAYEMRRRLKELKAEVIKEAVKIG